MLSRTAVSVSSSPAVVSSSVTSILLHRSLSSVPHVDVTPPAVSLMPSSEASVSSSELRETKPNLASLPLLELPAVVFPSVSLSLLCQPSMFPDLGVALKGVLVNEPAVFGLVPQLNPGFGKGILSQRRLWKEGRLPPLPTVGELRVPDVMSVDGLGETPLIGTEVEVTSVAPFGQKDNQLSLYVRGLRRFQLHGVKSSDKTGGPFHIGKVSFFEDAPMPSEGSLGFLIAAQRKALTARAWDVYRASIHEGFYSLLKGRRVQPGKNGAVGTIIDSIPFMDRRTPQDDIDFSMWFAQWVAGVPLKVQHQWLRTTNTNDRLRLALGFEANQVDEEEKAIREFPQIQLVIKE